MKHKEYIVISGSIVCETGLRIGGRREGTGIGETDNPIIRHPISRLPYIPGSSLKGKLRSLLEMKYCPTTQRDGKPATESPSTNEVTAMFGNGDPTRGESQPTRLIFRDCPLTPESERELREALPGIFADVKAEIAMNRVQGKTQDRSLREQERVPSGTRFAFSLTVRLFEEDDKRRSGYFEKLGEAFEMLESDYLGGNGTRGYGKVKILGPENQPMSTYIRSLR